MEYDFPIAESITEPMTLFSLFVLVSILGLAVYLFNRNRIISFGIFWFFITLSVESSIVPISDVIFEHRTYLPSFGFFIILVFVIYSLFGKRSTFSATILFVVIALSYSTLAYARNKVWKTDETLWKDVIEKSPNKARPKVNLGKYYIDRNQTQLAYEQFLAAEKINPNYFDAVQNSGVCELLLSKYDLSIIHIKKAIAIDTASARARYTLGLAYTGKQDWLNAIQSFDDALRIDSLYSRAYWKRGNAFGNLNRWDKALRDYNKTIALDPSNDVAWYERGNIYGIQKDYPKAIENYNGALALNPNLVGAYFYRAISYENMNQLDKALSDYETILRIDPNDSNAKRSRDALLVRMQGGKMANVIKNK
jgi:tetratricopeptide (TPR) repeat protein